MVSKITIGAILIIFAITITLFLQFFGFLTLPAEFIAFLVPILGGGLASILSEPIKRLLFRSPIPFPKSQTIAKPSKKQIELSSKEIIGPIIGEQINIDSLNIIYSNGLAKDTAIQIIPGIKTEHKKYSKKNGGGIRSTCRESPPGYQCICYDIPFV